MFLSHLKAVVLSLGLMSTLVGGTAFAQDYLAPVTKTEWSSTGSRAACKLSHPIPFYGRAVFTQLAGEPLTFAVHVDREAPKAGEAMLRIVPPHWKPEESAEAPETLAYSPGKRPFLISGSAAHRLLTALEKGRVPTLTYPDWHGAGAEVSVSVSVVNFAAALEKFLACSRAQFPFSFRDVNDGIIFFDLGQSSLNHDGKQRLRRLAKYLRSEPEMRGVVIKNATEGVNPLGHQDAIFRERAQAVQDYLVRQEVTQDRIHVLADDASDRDEVEGWASRERLVVHLFGPDDLNAVYFDTDIYVLDAMARRTLGLLARYLKVRPPQMTLVIEGHTDDVGRRRDNRLLSKRRAESVRRFLGTQGIASEQFKIRFFGERKPAFPNNSKENRRRNRRARVNL